MNENRRLHCAVICKNIVYVIAYKCEAYDIDKDEWTYIKPMNIKRGSFAATVIENKFIYTFGGWEELPIERYDIAQDTWQILDLKLNSANRNLACFNPEPNKVVVLGGKMWLKKVEQIDLTTGDWEVLPEMNHEREYIHNMVVFTDGHAYVADGNKRGKVEKYSYNEKKWIALPD